MDLRKLLSAVFPAVHRDRRHASRVLLQIVCRVIDIYGLFFGGGGYLLLWQTVAVAVAAVWAAIWTWVICKILEKTIGFRVSAQQEQEGLDTALHGQTARILDMSPNAVSPRKGPAPTDLDLNTKESETAFAGKTKVQQLADEP